jgi:hypothetical protein
MHVTLEFNELGVNKMVVNVASQDDAERARLFFGRIGNAVNDFDKDLKRAAKKKATARK